MLRFRWLLPFQVGPSWVRAWVLMRRLRRRKRCSSPCRRQFQHRIQLQRGLLLLQRKPRGLPQNQGRPQLLQQWPVLRHFLRRCWHAGACRMRLAARGAAYRDRGGGCLARGAFATRACGPAPPAGQVCDNGGFISSFLTDRQAAPASSCACFRPAVSLPVPRP